MKALRAIKDGPGAPTLSVTEIPVPTLGPGDVLVKIKASAVQPPDILNSKGGFSTTTFPRTLGKDFAGTVIQGPSSLNGKSVFGTSGSTFSFTDDGAQAEYAVLKQDALAEMPPNLTWAQAASIGTPLTTANLTLLRADLKEEDVVMVLGATGSVGSFVMQIAHARGCRTISVGRHGTDINSTEDPELKRAKELTGGRGPDVVVDTVGDFTLVKAAFDVMAFNGRIAFISAPRGGASTDLPIDILSLYRRQISLVGCNTAAHSQASMGAMLRELVPLLASGQLKVPEESSMSLINLDHAVEAYEGNIKGAVILTQGPAKDPVKF